MSHRKLGSLCQMEAFGPKSPVCRWRRKSIYTPTPGIGLSDSSVAGDILLVSKIGILPKSPLSDARGSKGARRPDVD